MITLALLSLVLAVAESTVLTNFALNKGASQSSTYYSMSKWVAANAVDGNMSTYSVTNSQSENWLIVDLETPVVITTKIIKIYLVAYAAGKGYYKNFKVSSKRNTKDPWVTCYEVAEVKGVKNVESTPLLVKCSGQDKMARFIRVSVNNKPAGPLYIKEIMVEEDHSDDFKKVGCFKKDQSLFHEIMITDLDPTHHKWGKDIDWADFQKSLHSLAVRCADKVRGKYTYFAIGFYGECWAGSNTKDIIERIYKPGKHASDQCIGGDYEKCEKDSKHECAGTEDNEYVYQIVEETAPPTPVSTKLRCGGIDNGCCTTKTPCSDGDGDCDHDGECAEGLICGKDNCPWGDYDDCCMKTVSPGGLRCGGINNGCCTSKTPCLEGDGDCDNDGECGEGLVCGVDNCHWGGSDDCCIKKEQVDPCSMPLAIGRCRAAFPRVYFNSATGQCTNFRYGGCGGNANNFGSIADCQKACGKCKNTAKKCNGKNGCGCYKSYCWSKCTFGWCYTNGKYGSSQNYKYNKCSKHEECCPGWSCAGACGV